MNLTKQQKTVVVLELTEEEAGKLRYAIAQSGSSFSDELWALLSRNDVRIVEEDE